MTKVCVPDRKTFLSVNASARKFFAAAIKAGKQEVSNTTLHQRVAKQTGQSRASVSGTLDTTGRDALSESPWYLNKWHKEKRGHLVVHCQNLDSTVADISQRWDYDFPEKQAACQKIMSYLPRTGTPRLLTFASCHGNCVQAALAQNPNTQIDNIEKRPEILAVWEEYKQQHGIQTTDFLGTLEKYVQTGDFAATKYDIVNADVMGYAGATMREYLTVINRLQNTRILALTTQHMTGFRNRGSVVDALRLQYDGVFDAHAVCIANWLLNYKLLTRWTYRRSPHHDTMEVFIFQRR